MPFFSNFCAQAVRLNARKREAEALQKFSRRLPCSRRIILTYDEEDTITDQHGTIEVLPVWKWLLN